MPPFVDRQREVKHRQTFKLDLILYRCVRFKCVWILIYDKHWRSSFVGLFQTFQHESSPPEDLHTTLKWTCRFIQKLKSLKVLSHLFLSFLISISCSFSVYFSSNSVIKMKFHKLGTILASPHAVPDTEVPLYFVLFGDGAAWHFSMCATHEADWELQKVQAQPSLHQSPCTDIGQFQYKK